MSGVFEALGDPVRRFILELLAGGECGAGEIVNQVQARVTISQPAVSQHLRVLRAHHLVRARAEGTRRIYAIDDRGLAVAQAWLAQVADPLRRGCRRRAPSSPVPARREPLNTRDFPTNPALGSTTRPSEQAGWALPRAAAIQSGHA